MSSPAPSGRGAQAGFSLIELMVVVAIIAIATAAVGLTAFNRTESSLRKDAERLVQLFGVAQSEARAGGRSIQWETDASGYRFVRRIAPAAASAHTAVRETVIDRFERDDVLRPRQWDAGNVTVSVSQIAPDARGVVDADRPTGEFARRTLGSGTVFTREWISDAILIELRSAGESLRVIRDAAGRYEVRL
ncbi:MAG: prepilin-type N-terminal cleavage/methylation domain-containing protein [Burkholderiaceae bacterium]|nr:prepilin-type N-terminal cleavage/methylation domain-containing protein [Burkholderiaceae bacterium]